jgi:DNA polymerase III delta prime subunit
MYDVWLRCSPASDPLPMQGTGFLKPAGDSGGGYTFIVRGTGGAFTPTLEPVSPADIQAVDDNFRKGNACLAEITGVAEEDPDHKKRYRQAKVHIVFFDNGEIFMGEKTRIYFQEDIAAGFLDKFTLLLGEEKYCVMQRFPNPEEETAAAGAGQKNDDMILHGAGVRLRIAEHKMDDGGAYLYVDKIIAQPARNPPNNIFLVRTELVFSSIKEIAPAYGENQFALFSKKDEDYFNLWEKYIKMQKEITLKKLRAIGAIRISGDNIDSSIIKSLKYKFFVKEKELDDNIIRSTEGNELVLTSDIPAYISNPDMSWEDVVLEWKGQRKKDENVDGINKSPQGKAVDASSASITVQFTKRSAGALKRDNGKLHFLSYSIAGDLIQIERKEKAWQDFKTDCSPLITALRLQGNIVPGRGKKAGNLKAMSWYVENKIFARSKPTPNQQEAIRIALNTPDVALIQGPPGTGKTTVIAAIIERLNEEQDKTGSIQGKTGVFAFQHDAVENIVKKLRVNALPTYKFGTRPNRDDAGEEFDEEEFNEKQLDKWVAETREKANSGNPVSISMAEKETALAKSYRLYLCAPSGRNARLFIRQAQTLGLPAELEEKAGDLLKHIEAKEYRPDESFARCVRGLRCNKVSFPDDGPETALNLRIACDERPDVELADTDAALLRTAARWREGDSLDFLGELSKLKMSLLRQLKPRPQTPDRAERNIEELYLEVKKYLDSTKTGDQKRDLIIAEYLDELEYNPRGIKNAIKEYNYVYAATLQQSAAKEISAAKSDAQGNYQPYDTVIVDEAARAAPPDLLIPLARAKTRVILVGDHRQLPHMVDQETEELLGLSQEEEVTVKTSMFEYLFNSLKKLEETDGIKRIITLDTQYRMHPLLGTFASENFYEKHSEKERFGNGAPERFAGDFAYTLSGIDGKPAIWMDIGPQFGAHTGGASKRRAAEAERIAERLKIWLGEDREEKLTFGVISFYSAQVDEIKSQLKNKDIDIKEINRRGERLRVGTVDSFQGMEFDIVFLSLVRCPRPEQRRHFAKSPFGFLVSENRLCVSMTRQKKALVVAGDSSLFLEPIAEKEVPALPAFYRLCQKHGKVLK